jgi:hypothetical protein
MVPGLVRSLKATHSPPLDLRSPPLILIEHREKCYLQMAAGDPFSQDAAQRGD